MDREFVLALLLAGAATMLANALTAGLPRRSVPENEASAFRRLVSPVSLALVVLAALAGFALVESDAVEAAEVVPGGALVPAALCLLVFVRAAARAIVGGCIAPTIHTAATIGLLRPRVVISERFIESLDPHERAAVEAHEEAHRRRYDPLRIWFGRLLADLQWPLPGVQARLSQWLHTIELARDDEARAQGIDGADLASAILKAARCEQIHPWASAGLADDGSRLSERIERLLSPQTPARPAADRVFLVGLGSALALALLLGACFGDVFFVEAIGWHS